ncbi:hypothetical protein ACFPL7_05810 [Dongia soli]|uniref:Uncharacterized protein n=1 Tax=Dongia soli TaxID=600628 RepID=A0ABU5EG96_9PROT|nr:hypothetical protein [Dongia soli]MDY0884917.1 hypothetical protein [Dongia soli]
MSIRTAEILRVTNVVTNVIELDPSLYPIFEQFFSEKYYVLSENACIDDVCDPDRGTFTGPPGTPNGPPIDPPEMATA